MDSQSEKEHFQLGFDVSKLEQTWQFSRVTNIITYGIYYFSKNPIFFVCSKSFFIALTLVGHRTGQVHFHLITAN